MKRLTFLLAIAFFFTSCESTLSPPTDQTENPSKDSLAQSPQKGWVQQESGTTNNLEDVHFVDPKHGWVVGNDILLHTDNGGKTWTPQQHLTPALGSVHFADSLNGWAAGDQMIQHTDDGGETWQQQGSAVIDSMFEGSGASIRSIHFTDKEHGWAVGTDASSDMSTILHTSDGGQNWEVQYEYGPELNRGDLAKRLRDIHFADPQTGWAVGGAREITGPGGSPGHERAFLMHTDDGGETWTEEIKEFPGEGGLWEVFFTDVRHGWIIGKVPALEEEFTDRPVSITSDGGETWSGQSIGGAADLHFVNPQTGWAVGDTIQHTTDGGQSWQPQESVTDNRLVSVSFGNKNNGWAVGRNGTILHYCSHH